MPFPSIDLPLRALPRVELPDLELPKVSLPTIDVPSAEQITGLARDAAFVGVGLAVMAVERLQALQAQLVDLVTSSAAEVAERVRDAV